MAEQKYFTKEERKEAKLLGQKKWRETHLEEWRISHRGYNKEISRKRRQEVISHYGGKCVCCGETYPGFLVIDHIDGGGGKHRKETGANITEWLRRNNYPVGFQVLCFNCNWGKYANDGICPHKSIKIEESLSDFESVGKMYKHFNLPFTEDETVSHLLSDEDTNFRLKFLREELKELTTAYSNQDLIEIADALIDLEIVVLGTLHLHGMPQSELFQEVQRSNMEKVRVSSPEQSKRGSSLDLIKPKGWKPPAIGRILKGHGWGMYKADE